MEKYLLDQLTEYASSDAYPLHMPGHKRQMHLIRDPYSIDITEIDGFDNLHHTGAAAEEPPPRMRSAADRGSDAEIASRFGAAAEEAPSEEILHAAQRRAAMLYGADETYYLINGSTCGILAAVSASLRRGERILMARNSHKAAYHAALLNGLHVTWLYPDMDERRGIYGSIRPEQVREALVNDPIRAVLITSPTYDGVVSDIRAIAEEVHRAGAVLIVDEAHGAHFAMHPYFPESALISGADIVINSLHKTMPSLTQTALLHIKGPRADRERLRKYLSIYQSSSPSYVLMAGMDECVRLMEAQGQELFDQFVRRLAALREHLGRLKVLYLVTGEEPEIGAYAFDRAKVLISTERASVGILSQGGERVSVEALNRGAEPEAECSSGQTSGYDAASDENYGFGLMHYRGTLTGPALAEILRKRYHLEAEMAAEQYVTAIMTVADTQEGFDRLEAALLEIDERLWETECRGAKTAVRIRETECRGAKTTVRIPETACRSAKTAVRIPETMDDRNPMHSSRKTANDRKISRLPRPIEILTMEEADNAPQEAVPIYISPGRTAAEFVYLYPPGIPLLVPGERVPDELPELLARYQAEGLSVQGMADHSARTLRCVEESVGSDR